MLRRTFAVQTASRLTSGILRMVVRFCEDLGTVGNISRESSRALALKLNSTPSCFQSFSYLKDLNQQEVSKSTQLIWHELWGEKRCQFFLYWHGSCSMFTAWTLPVNTFERIHVSVELKNILFLKELLYFTLEIKNVKIVTHHDVIPNLSSFVQGLQCSSKYILWCSADEINRLGVKN